MDTRRARLTPLRLGAILAVLLLFIALVSVWGSMLRTSTLTPHPPMVPVAKGQVYAGASPAVYGESEAGDASENEPDD